MSATHVIPNPPLPPAALSRGTLRTVAALTQAVAPPEPVVPDREARVAAFLAGYIPYLPPLMQRLLPLGLWLFEWGPILFLAAPHRYSRLGPAARERYLRSWQHSRWSLRRQLVKGLKVLVLMGYFELPEVKAAIGYDLAPHVSNRIKTRAGLLEGAALTVEPHSVVPGRAPGPARMGQ